MHTVALENGLMAFLIFECFQCAVSDTFHVENGSGLYVEVAVVVRCCVCPEELSTRVLFSKPVTLFRNN